MIMVHNDKVETIEYLTSLPDTVSLEEIIYHLSVRREIFLGLKDCEEGHTIPHAQVKKELQRYMQDLEERRNQWKDRLDINPEICFNKIRIKGTRIYISVIFDMFAAGESEMTILDEYPSLTKEDIRAAMAYASFVFYHRRIKD